MRKRITAAVLTVILAVMQISMVVLAEESALIVRPQDDPEIACPHIKRVSGGIRKITLTWSEAADEAKYQIYMSERMHGKYSKIATTSMNRFTKNQLKEGRTYYFKVRAYVSVDGRNVFSAFSSIRSGRTLLATVYITPSGKYFHRMGCDTLKGEKRVIRISRRKAIARKKKTCQLCKP